MGNQQERLLRLTYWFVALLEGEGCISLDWHRTTAGPHKMIRPNIKICMAELGVIETAKLIMDELGVGCFIHHRKRRGLYQESHELIIDGIKRCRTLLSIIHPYLIGKKEQSQTVLDFCDYRLSLPNRSHYGEIEENFKRKCSEQKIYRNKILNDLTPTLPEFGRMIKSGPVTKAQEAEGNHLLAS